ncbi:MAG: DnaJ domain-containing protein [Chthonomonadaceae bacterium]|nr:DnaJ domain-containing protein [Chthonomonadaceae bacterium]
MPTLYEILGIEKRAPHGVVRSAYRKLARTYHPDLNPDPKAHERMAKINAAFEVLSDPVRRMEYDTSIGVALDAEPDFSANGANRPEAVKVTLVRRIRAHKTPVYGMDFTPDSHRLVTSSFDNEVFWWETGTQAAERKLKLEGGVVNRIVATSDADVVASGATEQQLSCWRVRGGQVSVWRKVPSDWIIDVSPSPCGRYLATASHDRTAKIWTVSKGEEAHRLVGHQDSVTAVGWSADSKLLATGSSDAIVRFWSPKSGEGAGELHQVRSAVTSLAFSPDGKWLAVAAVDFSIRIFDLQSLTLRKTFYGHERPIEKLAFHPQSWLLASASRDGTLGLWNVVNGIGHGRIEASLQALNVVSFNPSGTEMVSGGLDKVLRIWRLGSPK